LDGHRDLALLVPQSEVASRLPVFDEPLGLEESGQIPCGDLGLRVVWLSPPNGPTISPVGSCWSLAVYKSVAQFLHTGDQVIIDDQGYVRMMSLLKEVIKKSSMSINPQARTRRRLNRGCTRQGSRTVNVT